MTFHYFAKSEIMRNPIVLTANFTVLIFENLFNFLEIKGNFRKRSLNIISRKTRIKTKNSSMPGLKKKKSEHHIQKNKD